MKKIKRLIAFLLIFAIFAFVAKTVIYSVFPIYYREYIEKCSEEYGLSPHLVMGVIYAESRFDNEAHSGVAHGLMQLTDETAEWSAKKVGLEGKIDLEEPETNIRLGCYYLSYLIEQFGELDTALAAYNAGMGNVSKWLSSEEFSADGKKLQNIPYAETDRYVRKVKKFTEIYKKLYK